MANRFRWLSLAIACVPAALAAASCGGDTAGDDTGTGGSAGTGGGTGGSGGTVARDASTGTGGTGGGAAGNRAPDGGRIPCGDGGNLMCPPNGGGNQQNRICDSAQNRCVQCLAESDCVGVMNAPHCNVMQGRCRACIVGNPAAACPTGQICLAGNNGNTTCVPSCATDTDCAMNMGNPACNTTTMTCAQCNTSAHCAANMGNPVCDPMTHRCEECLADTDCATQAGQPFCRNMNCAACRTVADCPVGATGCSNNGACQMPQPPRDGGMMNMNDARPPVQDARPEANAPRPEASVVEAAVVETGTVPVLDAAAE